MLKFIYCQRDKVSYNAMQSMAYEVYYRLKHFQMTVLHIPHFEPTKTKSNCKACKGL